MNILRPLLLTLLALAALILVACGGDKSDKPTATVSAKPTVTDPWVRATFDGQMVSAAYMLIEAENDALVGVSVPSEIAGRAELHQTAPAMENMQEGASEEMNNIKEGASKEMNKPGVEQMKDQAGQEIDKVEGAASEEMNKPGVEQMKDQASQEIDKAKGAVSEEMNSPEADKAKEDVNSSMGQAEEVVMPTTMKPVTEIPINGSVELKPGGYHIMLLDIKSPIQPGQLVPITLQFKKAGAIEVAAQARR